jgi:hypothetical protein
MKKIISLVVVLVLAATAVSAAARRLPRCAETYSAPLVSIAAPQPDPAGMQRVADLIVVRSFDEIIKPNFILLIDLVSAQCAAYVAAHPGRADDLTVLTKWLAENSYDLNVVFPNDKIARSRRIESAVAALVEATKMDGPLVTRALELDLGGDSLGRVIFEIKRSITGQIERFEKSQEAVLRTPVRGPSTRFSAV